MVEKEAQIDNISPSKGNYKEIILEKDKIYSITLYRGGIYKWL